MSGLADSNPSYRQCNRHTFCDLPADHPGDCLSAPPSDSNPRRWVSCPDGQDVDSGVIMEMLRSGQAILFTAEDLRRRMAELEHQIEVLA